MQRYSVNTGPTLGATIVHLLRRVDPFPTGTEDSGTGLRKRPKILPFPIQEAAQKFPGCAALKYIFSNVSVLAEVGHSQISLIFSVRSRRTSTSRKSDYTLCEFHYEST